MAGYSENFEPPSLPGGLAEEFLRLADKARRDLEDDLMSVDEFIVDAQGARNRMAAQLRALEQLLSDSSPLSDPDVPKPPRANADAVIDVLTEHDSPMHFREIHAALAESGFQTGGADPASALLTRFFDDFRLRRVARGTYELDRRYGCIFWPDGYVVDDGHGNKASEDAGWLGYAWETLRDIGEPRSCADLGGMAYTSLSSRHRSDPYKDISAASREKISSLEYEQKFSDFGCGSPDDDDPAGWHSPSWHLSALLNDLIVGDIKKRGEQASFRRVGPVGFATFEATDSPPPNTDFFEEFDERKRRQEAQEGSSPVRPESPASAEVGTRPQTADSPPDTALKIVSASEDGSAKANDRMSDEPRTMIDAALGILADALEPAIWEVRRLDLDAYRRVQNGDNGALTADDFADERRWASRQKPDRAMLKDPLKALKLLKRSRRIRVELLGANATWVKHLDKLSWRRVDRALDSAEAILLAIDARDAAEQVVALWPKDAA